MKEDTGVDGGRGKVVTQKIHTTATSSVPRPPAARGPHPHKTKDTQIQRDDFTLLRSLDPHIINSPVERSKKAKTKK
jgi:hypothetical protein